MLDAVVARACGYLLKEREARRRTSRVASIADISGMLMSMKTTSAAKPGRRRRAAARAVGVGHLEALFLEELAHPEAEEVVVVDEEDAKRSPRGIVSASSPQAA